jgi:RNA polymerase sigma-70 factor (ECF subfamily)
MTNSASSKFNPELWVDRYGDDLYGWAYHRTGKKAVAEDLVQETFLSALNAMDSFKGNSTEKTWLFAILKNKIVDHFRKAFVKYEKGESEMQHDNDEGSFLNRFFDRYGSWHKKDRPADWHQDETELLDDDEFRRILKFCMELLPDKWLALITLRFLQEKKTSEVCKELDITPSNLWVIMHRSKLQLRACIEENFLN